MIRIAVATHKEYDIPKDPLYVPVGVGAGSGAFFPESYITDDTGENISDRNELFSELTALYVIWKNHPECFEDADYLGLCHYRRYFSAGRRLHKRILEEKDIPEEFSGRTVFLPRKRNYIFETNYSHYANAHHREDLEIARRVISEKYPNYLDFFNRRMAMRTGHRFNMFIMPKELLEDYCGWLFDILFEVEKRLDISAYSGRDRRALGLVSERLLDVWLDANKIEYTELPYIMTEGEHLAIKGLMMIFRKLRAAVTEK